MQLTSRSIKIRSLTDDIASFTCFLQGLWPRSRQEALGTRLHLNGILSVMNVPTISRASFKSRERDASKAVEAVARQTCVDTIEIEKQHVIKMEEKADENNLIPTARSYDMGWQKRGKGFNSNTGQAATE